MNLAPIMLPTSLSCSHLRINPVDLRAAIPFKPKIQHDLLTETEVLHKNDSLQPLLRARLRPYALIMPPSLQDGRNRNVKTWSRPTIPIKPQAFLLNREAKVLIFFDICKFFFLLTGNIVIKANITRTITKNPPVSS